MIQMKLTNNFIDRNKLENIIDNLDINKVTLKFLLAHLICYLM